MKKFGVKLLLIVLVSLSFVKASTAKNADDRPVHEIHSMMIYNFIKYIQWPDYTENESFVIGVIGDDNVYNTLKMWYDGKVRGNKKFVIKKFNSPSEVVGCHIIYVAKDSSGNFDAIKNSVSNQSTLIITDKPGLGQKGSGINFKTVNGKLAFEMNQAVIEGSNLKVSGQLSAMAILI